MEVKKDAYTEGRVLLYDQVEDAFLQAWDVQCE